MIVTFGVMDEQCTEADFNYLAIAMGIKVVSNKSVLLMETGHGHHSVEESFMTNYAMTVKEPFFYDAIGLDYLLKRSSNHMLTDQNVGEAVVPISERLSYVPTAFERNKRRYEDSVCKQWKNIVTCIQGCADYVFINANGASERMKQILYQHSDLILLNLSQNVKVLDAFFSEISPYHSKTIYCMTQFPSEERLNLTNIARIYKLGMQRIGEIPYNSEFHLSMYHGKVLRFCKEPVLRSRYYKNQEFYKGTVYIADRIIGWSNGGRIYD